MTISFYMERRPKHINRIIIWAEAAVIIGIEELIAWFKNSDGGKIFANDRKAEIFTLSADVKNRLTIDGVLLDQIPCEFSEQCLFQPTQRPKFQIQTANGDDTALRQSEVMIDN